MKLTTESTVVNDKKLYTDIESAQTSADNAQDTADEAKVIADNTNQYFWFTSTGADTGAHISEIKQSDFLSSPSGGNLLARSNGIALRDGLTELAIFSADELRIGRTQHQRVQLTTADGISIYDDSNNQRIGINADEINIYDDSNNQRIGINADDGVIVGRQDRGHAVIDDEGMTIYSYDSTTHEVSDIAYFGDSIYLMSKNGEYPRVGITPNEAFFQTSTTAWATMTGSGFSITKDNDEVAVFGASARVGSEYSYNTVVDSTGIYFYDSGDYVSSIKLSGDNTIIGTYVNNSGTTSGNWIFLGDVDTNFISLVANPSLGNGRSLTLEDSGQLTFGAPTDRFYVMDENYLYSTHEASLGVISYPFGYVVTNQTLLKTNAPFPQTTTYSANWYYDGSNYYLARPTSSSKRYKRDIAKVCDSKLDPHKLYDVPVVQFRYTDGYLSADDPYNKTRHNVIGFIAEDIEKYYPIASIKVGDEVDNWNERYVIPPMLALIQEQHEDIEKLKAEIKNLKGVN